MPAKIVGGRREWNQCRGEGVVEDKVGVLAVHDQPAMGGAAQGHGLALALGKTDLGGFPVHKITEY